MNTRIIRATRAATAAIALALSAPLFAQDSDTPEETKPQPSVAAGIIAILESRLAQPPAERIPLVLRHEARCVAVFPNVIKAGIIVAGKRGKGLVSCRNSATGEWGPPLFYNLTEASVGLQAGIQSASIMLLVVDDVGVERLLQEKLAFGGDVSVAAGPLGAGKQVNIDTSVVSYVRSEGVFAGVQLGGTSIAYDTDSTTKAYGEQLEAAKALFGEHAVPPDLGRVRSTLNKFAPPKG